MTEENFILIAFIATPLLSGYALFLFFSRFRQHKRTNHRLLRLVAGNALLLVFLCSLLALGGEIRFRFFYDTTDSFGLMKTTRSWFDRHFQFNNASFRDSVSYPISIPSGQRRVSFLGDSFTAGHGVPDVEDRFVNRIRQANPDWDVQMLARCGWDTGHELAYLEETLQYQYELDVVVLVYCLNDIADIVPEWTATLSRIYSSSDPGFVIEHSYLFNTLYFRWKASQDPDVSNYYQFVTSNYQGRVWDEQCQRLTRLRDEVDARNGRLIVVTFPFVHALDGDYPYMTAHERLSEFWESLSVPHLDLLKVFTEHDDARSLVVNPRDAHPNEHAHALVAPAITTFLDHQITADGESDGIGLE